MKVCFFGLGSIGKRHLINLNTIAVKKNINLHVHAFRKTLSPIDNEIKGLVQKIIYSENELDNDYDIVFITNPTNMHFDTMKLMENKTKNMFIEKPIVDYKEYDFSNLKMHDSGVYYVAGPLRFSGVIQKLKNIIKNEKIYCARSICSSYLPDWRPNIDYRNVYSAKREQGGGVRADLIHEWDYITYLFGFPEEVKCICGKYSHLDIDSDDVAIYIARYKDKLVEVHLDYFGRVPKREIEILTKSGTIIGDIINETIRFSDGRDCINMNIDKNNMYLNEMEFFIDNIIQKSSYNNVIYCKDVLDLALGRV
jgi:predicted dehydrogenase